MRYALIIICLLILAVTGLQWPPAETISAIPELETPAGPVYYQTIPVEYIDFEPLHIDVVRHVADVHPGQDVLYNEN
jgi:hypothetical protein